MSNQLQPTPGPWFAEGSEQTTATWVQTANGKRIATIKPGDNDWGNAKLCAAAPELLVALRRVMKSFGGSHNQSFNSSEWVAMKMVEAAIKKAEEGK